MLRASLWGNPPEDGVMSATNFHGVLVQAKRQTVVGLLAQALTDEHYQVRLPKPDAIQTFVSQQEIPLWRNFARCCRLTPLNSSW